MVVGSLVAVALSAAGVPIVEQLLLGAGHVPHLGLARPGALPRRDGCTRVAQLDDEGGDRDEAGAVGQQEVA